MRSETWASTKSCLSRCLSGLRSWARPSFSRHWGNWILFPALAFALGFLPASFVQADDTYQQGYYWNSYYPSPKYTKYRSPFHAGEVACSTYSNCTHTETQISESRYSVTYSHDVPGYCTGCGGTTFTVYRYACGADTGSYCQPPQPKDCSELASQSDPFNVDLTNNQEPLQLCNQGCNATRYGGLSTFLADGTGIGSYEYDGTPCPGGDGYDPEAGIEDNILETEPPKSCFGADGSYLGQVSANATCPNRVNCYSTVDGSFVGTADGSTSCTGDTVTKTQLENNPDLIQQTSSTEVGADGTVTESTETTTTQTGADGSTHSSTTSYGKTTSPDGTVTESESTTETVESCSGDDCPEEPQVTQADDCDEDFVCNLDPVNCEILRIERENYCEARPTVSNIAELKALVEGKIEAGELGDPSTDNYGQLESLDAGTVDIGEEFNLGEIWSDRGAAGSCPAPYTMDLMIYKPISFDWHYICEYATAIRVVVIFAAIWLAGAMVSRTVLGTSYTTAR